MEWFKYVKKILILGCGYVGSAVATRALERGMRVVAVTRNAETVKQLETNGVEAYVARVDSDEWHAMVGQEFDYAVNCVSAAGNGLVGYRESYIRGTQCFVDWMRASEFSGRAVYTSSVSVYADSGGDWVFEDDASPNNDRGRIIRESEECFLETGYWGLKRCVLRLGGIYGPERHMILNRLRSAADTIAGNGDYFLNLIRLEDIVAAIGAIFEADESPGPSIFNVVDNEPVRKAELVSWLAERLGRPCPRFDMAATARNSSRRFSGEPRQASNRRVSNALLQERLGWQPRFPSYREGFADLLG